MRNFTREAFPKALDIRLQRFFLFPERNVVIASRVPRRARFKYFESPLESINSRLQK